MVFREVRAMCRVGPSELEEIQEATWSGRMGKGSDEEAGRSESTHIGSTNWDSFISRLKC